jgi:hypothetical protein
MTKLDSEDLKAIKDLIEVTIDEAIEERLVTKDIIGQLLTRNDFYKKMDEVMVELKMIGLD